MSRTLYLVCYDVASPRRLRRIHRCVKAYAIGGQKSFYECWLTAAELAQLRIDLTAEMDVADDRVHLFQLDPRMTPVFLGRATRQSSAPFLIV
jgi:CRISPR-associated protein Cas2